MKTNWARDLNLFLTTKGSSEAVKSLQQHSLHLGRAGGEGVLILFLATEHLTSVSVAVTFAWGHLIMAERCPSPVLIINHLWRVAQHNLLPGRCHLSLSYQLHQGNPELGTVPAGPIISISYQIYMQCLFPNSPGKGLSQAHREYKLYRIRVSVCWGRGGVGVTILTY